MKAQYPPTRKPLSPKELQVLKLMCADKGTHEIASILNRSDKTIWTHRVSISRKTGAHTPIGFLVWALNAGEISPTEVGITSFLETTLEADPQEAETLCRSMVDRVLKAMRTTVVKVEPIAPRAQATV